MLVNEHELVREAMSRDAAAAMLRGGFRHLIVLDGNNVVGMLSVRDVVRSWAKVSA